MPLNGFVEKRRPNDRCAQGQHRLHVVSFQAERRGDHIFAVAEHRLNNRFGHPIGKTNGLDLQDQQDDDGALDFHKNDLGLFSVSPTRIGTVICKPAPERNTTG